MTLTLTTSVLLLGDMGIASGLVSKLSLNNEGPARARAIMSSAYAIVGSASIFGIILAAVLAVALPWNSWTGASNVSAFDIHMAAFFALAGRRSNSRPILVRRSNLLTSGLTPHRCGWASPT